MKKVFCILLALALMAPLCALGEENVTLLVWESDGVELEFIKAAAEKYHELHPNVSFEFNAVAHTDAVQKLEMDGPSMVGPDLFAAPHDKLGQMVTGELILPNPKADEVKNNFMDAAINGVTYNDTIWGYPTAVETYTLFYNKDLIATPPTTWEEVEKFCAEYNDPAANKYGIVWEVSAAYYNYIFLSAYGSDLFGPQGTDAASHGINTPESIKGMEYFATLKDKILPVVADDMTGAFCQALFMDNKTAAMYITGPWSINTCLTADMNFGVTTIPALPGCDTPPTSFSGVRAMFVSAFTDHPEEAADFANFLLSSEMQTLRYEMTDTIPPRADVKIENEYFAGIMAQAAYAKPMPSIPQMDGYWVSMASAFKNIWNGEDVKNELDAAAAYVEAIK